MKIEFKLSLQRLSLLSAAQAVWDKEDIRDGVINHFLTTKVLDRREEWNVIIKKALQKVPPTSLPSVLHSELLFVIKSTGVRIYNWFLYLRNIKFFGHSLSRVDYDKYLKKIFWTHYGTIDEVKTLKYFWLENGIECWKMFDLACCYCAKDAIDDMWEKISSIKINCEYNCLLYENYSSHILAYWIHYQSSTLDTLMLKIYDHGDVESLYETIYSIEENMLRMAVKCGFHLAVKYFWKLLKDEQRKRNEVFCFEIALHTALQCMEGNVKDQYIEISIFLFNNVTEETKAKIFGQEYWSNGRPKVNLYMRAFIEIFMTSYPWQNLITPVFMELKSNDYSVRIIDRMFCQMANQIMSDSEIGLPVENSSVQRQFCVLWRRIPSNFKQSIAFSVLHKLLDLWNMRLIKCVLYDTDLKAQRMILLAESYRKCKFFHDNEGYEMFDEFVDNLLIFDDWEDEVKILMKKLYISLKNFKLNEATQLLYSQQEKKITHSMIDHALLCYFFIKKDLLDEADKVLWWALDYSNFFVHNFKEKLNLNKKFSRYYIYSLWLIREENEWNFGTAEKLSTKYLHCLLDLNGSHEIDMYITDIVSNLKAVKFSEMQKFFISKNKFKALNKFLDWCNNVSSSTFSVKDEYIAQGCVERMCKRYIEENDLHSMEQLLKWAYPTDTNRLDFKHNFITSVKGTEFLKYFIATTYSTETDPNLRRNDLIVKFKSFIQYWLKPLNNISGIVETIDAWNRTVAQKHHDDLDGLIDFNLDLGENATVIAGFREYKDSSRKHLFWHTGNYVLFMKMLGCSHCHFRKTLTNTSDDD